MCWIPDGGSPHYPRRSLIWVGPPHVSPGRRPAKVRDSTTPSVGCLSTPLVSCFFLVSLSLPWKTSPVWLNTHIGNGFIPFFGSSLPLVRSRNRTWQILATCPEVDASYCSVPIEMRNVWKTSNRKADQIGFRQTAGSLIKLRWNRQLFPNRSERRCLRETCCLIKSNTRRWCGVFRMDVQSLSSELLLQVPFQHWLPPIGSRLNSPDWGHRPEETHWLVVVRSGATVTHDAASHRWTLDPGRC